MTSSSNTVVAHWSVEASSTHDATSRLERSLRLLLKDPDGRSIPLNGGAGVAFARAAPTDRSEVRAPRDLVDPVLVRTSGIWVVVAQLVDAHGAPVEPASSVVLTSADLVSFSERLVAPLVDPASDGLLERLAAVLPEIVLEDAEREPISIDAAFAEALIARHRRVRSIAAEVPPLQKPRGRAAVDALAALRALVRYDDGSTARLPVTADADRIDALGPGTHVVPGRIEPGTYAFPFIAERADPTILHWQGSWLFIATDDRAGDNVHSSSLSIRSADSIEALPDAEEHRLLQRGDHDLQGCFWAPELHVIEGGLHCYFSPSVGAASWDRVQSYVMRLRDGGDPTRAQDWMQPQPVRSRSGERLQVDEGHPGISLDMTVFEDAGRWYAAWSQRCTVPVLGDPDVWIARFDPQQPERLTSDAVRIVRAEYAWDTNTAIVAEGPFVVARGGTVFMTYSGSGVGPTYATGLVTAPSGADLLDPTVWSKRETPVLASDPAIGQWGPGHNSFTATPDGELLLVYHAKESIEHPERSTGIRRVHWAADGGPVLDMRPDEVVAPELRDIALTVVVEP